MQRIQPRHPAPRKFHKSDAPVTNTLGISPIKYVTGDHPEHFYGDPAMLIRVPKKAIERQLGTQARRQVCIKRPDEQKMLIMKYQHCDGANEPQELDACQLVTLPDSGQMITAFVSGLAGRMGSKRGARSLVRVP